MKLRWGRRGFMVVPSLSWLKDRPWRSRETSQAQSAAGQSDVSRRDFLVTTGALGATTLGMTTAAWGQAEAKQALRREGSETASRKGLLWRASEGAPAEADPS